MKNIYKGIGLLFYLAFTGVIFAYFYETFSAVIYTSRDNTMQKIFDDQNKIYNFCFSYFVSILTFIFFLDYFQKHIFLIKYITYYLGISLFYISSIIINEMIKYKEVSLGTTFGVNSHWIYFLILWVETLIFQYIKSRVSESKTS
jgi:hypothetical protein